MEKYYDTLIPDPTKALTAVMLKSILHHFHVDPTSPDRWDLATTQKMENALKLLYLDSLPTENEVADKMERIKVTLQQRAEEYVANLQREAEVCMHTLYVQL